MFGKKLVQDGRNRAVKITRMRVEYFWPRFTLTVLLQINQEGERSIWVQQKLEGVMGVANSY